MSKILPILTLLLLTFRTGYAQPQKAWISAADTAFAEEDYYAAFKYYEVALEYDSSETRLWFNYANAARKFNAFPYAEKGYEKVLAGRDTARSAEAAYWLAFVQLQQGKYNQAAQGFQHFLDEYEVKAPQLVDAARRNLDKAHWAVQEVQSSPVDSIRHLGPEINTPYSEFGASYLNDTLYYSSYRFTNKKDKHDPPRLYIKVLRSVNGTEGELMPEDFNLKGKHTANTAFSPDGNLVFFTLCDYISDGEVRCNLYQRQRMPDGSWGDTTKLNINAEGYTSTQPAYAYYPEEDEAALYFVSNRPGGKGSLDIWYSVRNSEGVFEAPQNLETINTSGDDVTPAFHQRSQSLFFSSDGRREGIGGLDVYQTKRQPDGSYSPPQNLGIPLNSSYNDTYYSLNNEGSLATFSSDRAGSTYIEAEKEACCYDIYQADINIKIDLLARTFNSFDQNALEGATVNLYEITPEGEEILVGTITNPLSNDFRFPLERYKKYRIEAVKEGFEPATVPLDLTDTEFSQSTTIERDLFLAPATVDLQALTFDAEDNSPLAGATVSLMELEDGTPKMVDEQTNTAGNDFLFPLQVGKTYIITADKPGYKPVRDTIRFTPEDIARLGPRPTVELYLERINFDDFLPLALYFDNDAPDRRSYNTTTDKTYGETYEAYYSKKLEFVNQFTEGMSESDSFRIAQNYENFFDRDVRGGYTDLISFSNKLLPFLEEGNTITIKLKGYASPRASDRYNYILSQRRISSLKNHFREYQDGSLLPYIKKGQLVIEEEAFGESAAAQGVPDDIRDQKGSIYSLLASVERRVEIVEVTAGGEEKTEALTRNRD